MQAAREGRAATTFGLLVTAGLLAASTAGPLAAQEDALSIEGLVVTASPTTLEEDAVASHVTILDSEDLRRFGDRSLADALRRVSGVQVVRGGSFGAATSLFVRGGESDYTLVLVDGVQVNQPGGGFDFAELTTDNVERVEIVRGPASALYGSDAVAGVIHVITRTGSGGPAATVSLEAGSFGRLDVAADLRAGTEGASYGVSLARRSTDGVLAFNNRHVQTVLSGAARFRPDDRTDVRVNLRLSGREYHFPTNSSGSVVDTNAFSFSDATTARVSVTHRMGRRLAVEASAGVHETDGGTDDAPDGPADTLGFYGFTSLDHFRRAVGEVRTHLYLDPAVLTAGFEYEEERQRSFTESLSEFATSADRSRSERSNLGYFVHASGRAGGVSYQAGGRLEDNERFGRSATWQAGIASPLPVGSSTRLRASVGTAIKEPTFFENFATGFARGNPDLEPERSTSWEIGFEQSLLEGAVTAGATYFDQAFEDLIQYTFSPPSPGDPNYFNVAAADARGVEVDLDVRDERWSVGASWSWTDTEVTDSGFDQGEGATFVEGEQLLRRPRHRGSLHAAAGFGRIEMSARVRHVGERHDRDFETFPATPAVLPDYRLVSLGGAWRVTGPDVGGPSATVELRVENILDESYQELLGFPGPGRGIYVGASIGLGR